MLEGERVKEKEIEKVISKEGKSETERKRKRRGVRKKQEI